MTLDGRTAYMVMMKFLGILAAAAVALGLLLVTDQLLEPAPIPAAGGVIGGVVGLRFGRSRLWIILAVASGILVGAAIHLYTHVTGGSPSPSEGLLPHVAEDAAIGLAATLVIIPVAVLIKAIVENQIGPWAASDRG